MAREINSNDNIVHVRNVIERFEELRDERSALEEAVVEAQNAFDTSDDEDGDLRAELAVKIDDAKEALSDFEQEELDSLKTLLENLEGSGGDHQWEGAWYPLTLIADSHFEDYARAFAEDVGAIDDNARWPCTCIDWEKAASELLMNYSSVTWDGNTFWYQ